MQLTSAQHGLKLHSVCPDGLVIFVRRAFAVLAVLPHNIPLPMAPPELVTWYHGAATSSGM
jgi:hypothetical protein